jgi:very-short-patch-repair endonuclease
VCRFKTESILLQFLQQKGFSVRPQFTAAWCIDPFTGGRPRFDYEFPDLKIILELDGRQHFQQVRNWKCPIEQTESDVFKMRQANKQGYSVIRLLQEEVWEGREPWLEANLLEVLVTHADIKNIFIATDEHIYDRHIELLEGDE